MASKYARRIPYDKMDTLIHKIFPFMTRHETQLIRQMIDSNNSNNTTLLNPISLFITNYVKTHAIQPDKYRQSFIIEKINKFLAPHLREEDYATWKFVDIGGGNGKVLSGLNNSHKLNEFQNKPMDHATFPFSTRFKENYICVETLTDWGESYAFDNDNITYLFLHGEDPVDLRVEPESVDVILCMCSLHHMNNDTLVQMLQNMKRILKPCGKILVKEHDAIPGSKTFIEWEHHLYHMLDCAYAGKMIDVDTYFDKSIHNFKTKEHWTDMFGMAGFKLASTHNRFLDGDMFQDNKNITELYWAVYEHAPVV